MKHRSKKQEVHALIGFEREVTKNVRKQREKLSEKKEEEKKEGEEGEKKKRKEGRKEERSVQCEEFR